MNVAEVLRVQAVNRPNALAIIESRGGRARSMTFAELNTAAARSASLLRQAGLSEGDAVLIFQPMSAELYVALAAIFRLKLLAMFVDPSSGLDQIEQCCSLVPPRALIASSKAHSLRLRSAALRAIRTKFVIGPRVPGAISWRRSDDLPPHAEILPCEPQQPALLTFTSGTLAEPKAAIRTHGFLLSQHRVLAEAMQLQAGDADLTTFPIVLLANLASGVSSHIPDANLRDASAIQPAPVVAQIRRHKIVSSAASPAFFEQLARYCSERGLTLPSLQKLFTGGAPVYPRLIRQLTQMAPQSKVVAVYGSTEAEPIAHVAAHQIGADDHQRMLSGQGLLAGMPVSAIRVRILADAGNCPLGSLSAAEFDERCPPGCQPGEIVVSGEHVLTGYLNGRGDREAKIRVGDTIWHRTGDAGYFDSRGRLWLLGRASARIQDRHGVLFPFSIEPALYEDTRVRRTALVSHEGRRIVALEFFEPRTQPDGAQLGEKLAWAHIDEVRVCGKIPVDRRHRSKIDYPALHRTLDNSRSPLNVARRLHTPNKLKHRWSLSHNYLAGVSAGDWWRILRENRFAVDPVYWHRAAFVTCVSFINSYYRWREDRRHGAAVEQVEITQPPLFILGHWRSGTTHLHNLLALDTAQFTYPNTYQVVNPHTFLTTEDVNTRRFAFLLPDKRPMDNMALSFQSPQEDEFALLLGCLRSLYLGVSFPRRENHYRRYLAWQDVNRVELDDWKAAFLRFVKKLTYKYRRAVVMKSPPHTARIRLLLELFPAARFVHIHRNPYEVFRSCQHYFDTACWHTYLQRPDLSAIDGQILERYTLLYDAFFAERGLIPQGNYHELGFEDLERDPVEQMRVLYERLSLPGFDAVEPKLRGYVESLSDYKKNDFDTLSPRLRQAVAGAWHRSFETWGYCP